MAAMTQPIRWMMRPRKGVAYQGMVMLRHDHAILVLQWFAVVFFTTLVVVPAFLLLGLSGLARLVRSQNQFAEQTRAEKIR